MALALQGGRMAIGSWLNIWEYHDVSSAAASLDPPGRYDACFLPRRCHFTGNILAHEIAWGQGDDLWITNTRFSCLCTIQTPPGVSCPAGNRRSSHALSRQTAAT